MRKKVQLKTGKFKSFDGTEIYYEVRGEGAPVVFIYGIACLMNHWHHQYKHFSQNYQVITFDLRGHHQSAAPKDSKDLSLVALARDLSCLLQELRVNKAHVVGHSFGAQIILQAYELSPEIFKSISFINGFAKNPLKGMFGLDLSEPLFHLIKTQYEKNPFVVSELWKLAVDNPVAMIASAALGGFNLKLTEFKDIEIYARGVAALSLDVLIPYFEDMIDFQGEKIAQTIKVPALILSGEKDMVTPQKFQHELHEAIRGSELVTVPYGSHCTQLDFPDYINLKLEDFIERCQVKSPRAP